MSLAILEKKTWTAYHIVIHFQSQYTAIAWVTTSKGPSDLQGIEAVRRVIGAGRNTAKTPKDLVNFDPANNDLEYDYHLALGYGEPRLL